MESISLFRWQIPVRRTQQVLLYALLVANCVQYSVLSLDSDCYNVLRKVIMGLFVCLCVTVPLRGAIRSIAAERSIKIMALSLAAFSLLSGVLWSFNANISFSAPRDLLVTLAIVVCGYNLKVSLEEFETYLSVYVILGAVVALSILIRYGFSVPELYPDGLCKNQLGVLYGILFLVSLQKAFRQRGNAYFVLCSVVLFWVLAVMRARAALVTATGLMFVFIFLVPEETLKKRIVVAALILCAFVALRNEFYAVFFSGKEVNNVESISSGRLSRILQGLEYLSHNLLAGSLWESRFGGKTIHVYALKQVVDFGILLAFPLLIVYGYLFFQGVYHTIRPRVFNVLYVSPYCLLFLFVESLNEYSYPFSPASSTFLVYLMFGLYLKTIRAVPICSTFSI